MGSSENIAPWNNSRQRVHPKDKRLVPNHDSVKLAKKRRGTSSNDQELSRDPRLKFARKNHSAIS